jgi:tetratricopeptide (TPR) repeat protein
MATPQQPAQQKNPQVEALRAQAREAYEAKRLQEAYQLYQQIIEISPRDNEANEKVGLIAMQRLQGLLKEADAFMRAKKYKDAEAALLELLELDPNNKLAAQKLRMIEKMSGDAKVFKFVKLGLAVVALVVVVCGGIFAWNNIQFSDGKKAILEERFDIAKEKFEGTGTFGVSRNELDMYKRFNNNMIQIVEMIPKHEYYDSRRLLNDCESLPFGRQHPVYLKWTEEWDKAKEKWCTERLAEAEASMKKDDFDKCYEIVGRDSEREGLVRRQDPKNQNALALRKKNQIAEGIFKGFNALNDRNLPEARAKAVEALRVVDAKSPEGVRATELKEKAKMALIREKKKFDAHEGYAVLNVAVSRDGKVVCSTGGDGFLKAFDANKLTETKALKVTNGDVFGLALSGDSAYAAIAYYKTVKVLGVGGWSEVQSLPGHDVDRAIRTVAFSTNGYMASGSEGQVRVWRVPSFGEPFAKLTTHAKMVNCVAFSADEKYLASVADDDKVKVYRVAPDGVTEIHNIELPVETGPITCAFSPDNRFLVIGTRQGAVLIYSVREPTWDKFKTLSLKEKIQSLAFSPNSEFVALGGSMGTLFVYETQKFNEAWSKPKAHSEQINAVSFYPNSENVVTGSRGQIKIWEPEP